MKEAVDLQINEKQKKKAEKQSEEEKSKYSKK